MSDNDTDRNKTLDELRDTPPHVVCHHGRSQRSCDACECLALDDECGVLKERIEALETEVPEFQEWSKKKPKPFRVFCVYEPIEERVTMVRELHSDDLSGDVTWCPHTGKEHFGDMHHDFLWCYAPKPRGKQ